MKFSIVMPVLDGARFIGAAIESVRAQSHQDWELLIMDGGSSDGTADIARDVAKQDPRISVHLGRDQGMYDAILNGFERASGAWLAWLNSDDLYAPWCLATVAQFVDAGSSSWVTGCPGCWDAEGNLRYLRPAGLFPRGLIRAGWFHQNLFGYLQQESIFFSKDLFEKLAAPDVDRVRSMRYAGDFLLWRLFAEHASLDPVPSVLGGFRRHETNLSRLRSDEYLREVKQTQPFMAPNPIAGMLAVPYRALSSWAMVKAAGYADDRLSNDLNDAGRS